jgi:DNA polymerase III delta subunit
LTLPPIFERLEYVADKNGRRKQAAKQLEKLLEEHLATCTPAEQAEMHERFEKRVSSTTTS